MASFAFFIGLDVIDAAWLQRTTAQLAHSDAQRLATLQQYKRQREFVAARALLNALADKLVYPGEVAYYPSGKPYWQTKTGAGYCAISHSHNGVLVGLDNSHSIGVDIETLRERNLEALVNRYFHAEARTAFTHATGRERLDVFYQWWCSREALVKYDSSTPLLTRLQAPWPEELTATLEQYQLGDSYLNAIYEGLGHWYQADIASQGFTLTPREPSS